MTTYNVRDFKAKTSQILRELESTGEEVVITRHGKPVGKLVPISNEVDGKRPLSTVQDDFSFLPEISDEDFKEIKKMWRY